MIFLKSKFMMNIQWDHIQTISLSLSLSSMIRLVNWRHYESFCWSVCSVRSGSAGVWYVLPFLLFSQCVFVQFWSFILAKNKVLLCPCVSLGSAIKCYHCKDYSGSCSKIRDCYYDDACVSVYERGVSSLIL